MANPPTAARFGQTLDPHEELDWLISLDAILEMDEAVASYGLALLPEAIAMGLTLMSGGGRDNELINEGRAIRFWAAIDEGFQENPAFDGGGVALPMELIAVTDAVPARTRNRTFLLQVAQQ